MTCDTTQEPNDYPQTGGYMAPLDVSVFDNMQKAQQIADKKDVLGQYLWFYNQVKNDKNRLNPNSWDYKQQGSIYEGLGNFNYGATGTAMGIPAEVD